MKRNGVDWAWKTQKEREAVEKLAEEWINNKIHLNYKNLSDEERKKFNDNVSQAKLRSKNWPDWKRSILLNAGIILPEKNTKNDEE